MKDIIILGATGSIGTQTLEIIRENSEKYNLIAFSSGVNINKTRDIINEFSPSAVSVTRSEDADALKSEFPDINIYCGESGLLKISTYPTNKEAILVTAVSGAVGLLPTLEAIKMSRTIALANKETLVSAGHIVMDMARNFNSKIIPVDSEHSAIYQCMQGESINDVKKLIITASGGSFRDKTRADLKNVTVKDALSHPNWSMGSKITIDSATMMNKGLEVIEAHWLFNLPYEKIETVMHRESVIHSMVEFNDNSTKAQLGIPSMKVPIAYALSYPSRNIKVQMDEFDIKKYGSLTFEELSFERFPCLKMAFEAGKVGGTMPTVMNAANEVAVDLFLKEKISFLGIEDVISDAMSNHKLIQNPSLEEILNSDKETREYIYNKYN